MLISVGSTSVGVGVGVSVSIGDIVGVGLGVELGVELGTGVGVAADWQEVSSINDTPASKANVQTNPRFNFASRTES